MEKVENLKETGTKNEVLIDKEESAIDKKATEKNQNQKLEKLILDGINGFQLLMSGWISKPMVNYQITCIF